MEAEEAASSSDSGCACQIPVPVAAEARVYSESEPLTVGRVEQQAQVEMDQERQVLESQKAMAQQMKDIQKEAKKAQTKEQKKREKDEEKRAKEEEKNAKAAEQREIKRLSHMIDLYRERFPNLAPSFPKLSAKPTKEECLDDLLMIHEVMTSQGSVKSISHLVSGFLTFAEKTWGDGQRFQIVPPELRFNIRGITRRFESGCYAADLDPLLLELDIEYPWLGRRSLFARFADAMIHIILDVNERNTNPEYAKLKDAVQQGPLDI